MATTALLIWPLIALGIFAGLGPSRGLIWTCVIGYLFLPEHEAFDLPGLPSYGKYFVISLSLVLGVLVTAGREDQKPDTTDKTVRLVLVSLISVFFLGILGTILDNTEALNRAGRFQQGHSIRDLISLTSEAIIALVPFFLARRWLSDPKQHEGVLFVFVALALVYSLLVLFELRMSPQLNRWIYDFFPHSWSQHVRGGGFRPIVFLSHGLSVGFFLLVATLSAVAMFRNSVGQPRVLYALAGLWILAVLFLSRNLGATLLALMFAPAILLFGRRAMILTTTSAALLFMLYPVARASLPTDQFVSVIASFSPSRAQSLEFRLDHEDKLVERAMEKPVFGWGGWGRSRLVDEKGRDSSVIDGAWIFRLGAYGWIGYIAYFGLIAGPIYLLKRRRDASFATIGLAAILSVGLLYSIPNAEINPLVWLSAGALAGFLQYGRTSSAAAATAPSATNQRQVVYSRFAPKSRETRRSPYSRNT